MKRALAILCAVAMMFTFCLGASASELDFMDKEYKSFEATTLVSVKLNKPFDFIGAITKTLQEDGQELADLQRLAESLFNTTYTVNQVGEISNDYLKGKLYAEMSADVPIEFSDDLKIGVGAKVRIWMEYDFSDAEHIVCRYIITSPITGKYMVYDLASLVPKEELTEAGKMMTEAMKKFDVSAGTKEIMSVIKSVLEGNAKITRNGLTVKVDIAGDKMGKFLCEAVEGFVKSDYMTKIVGEEVKIDSMEMAMAQMTIDSLDLFADDAVGLTYTLDRNGYLSASTEAIHIDLNIAKIAEALGASEAELYPLTKENSNVDLTVSASAKYSNVNKATVTMPALTEENSVDMAKKFKTMVDYDYDDSDDVTYQTAEFNSHYIDGEFADEVDMKNISKGLYMDAYSFFGDSQFDADELSADIQYDELTGDITVKCRSKYIGEKVISAKAGSNIYTIDGVEHVSAQPVKVQNSENGSTLNHETGETMPIYKEQVLFGMDIYKEAFGVELNRVESSVGEDGLTNGTYISTTRPNLGYAAE